MNSYDREHLDRLLKTSKRVKRIFRKACKQAAAVGIGLADADADAILRMLGTPTKKAAIEQVIASLAHDLETYISAQVRAEWELSNAKNDAMVETVMGASAKQAPAAWVQHNADALKAFTQRKTAGMNLSERVWQYTEQMRPLIENGLAAGITKGTPATRMAEQLMQYVQHYDRYMADCLSGGIPLSGEKMPRGVYRSPYDNALRLAATETNIAYRTADHERWQQMGFVVGVRVQLSNNHNCKGVPKGAFVDMCDHLKGDYPKDFKFTGWHPRCRCYAVPIMKDPKEVAADMKRIARGETIPSESRVTDLPDGAKQWVKDNADRIGKMASPPYWVKDNRKAVDKAMKGKAIGS